MATDWIAKIKKALCEMSINSSDFDLNQNGRLPNNRKLSKAGVLVGICFPQQGEPTVLLTKRASHLTNHPSQVAFPGGGGRFDLPLASAMCVTVALLTTFLGLIVLRMRKPHQTSL